MAPDLVRNLSLLLPVLAVLGAIAVARCGRSRADAAVASGALLGTLLALVGVLAVEASSSWWTFAPSATAVFGIPLETAIGWALVWGALPALVGGPLWLWLAGFAWLDVLLVPRLDGLVTLGEHWWWGELVLLTVVALPAALLSLLTRERRRLGVRVSLQVVTFGGLVLWLVPEIAVRHGGGSWSTLLGHPFALRVLLVALAGAAGVLALAAVIELAAVGRGTPWPWDPPERLVTSGPYAYLANPMQVGGTGLLLVLAVGLRDVDLVLAAVVATVFSTALADPHERRVLAARWRGFAAYRADVPNWRPRWRPVATPAARLWLSEECGVCRATGRALRVLGPLRGVQVVAAEDAGVRLTRARWVDADGGTDRGVAAVARALERTTLPAAWLCWAVRLPGVRTVVQLVADVCGLGPRAVAERSKERMSR